MPSIRAQDSGGEDVMDDQTAIDEAYQESIRDIYSTLLTEIQMAKGDAQLEAAAKARFASGITFARRVHAMASELVGKPTP
ncbi:hypothetical protein DVT68_15505 [Dyella solisilvae]|uniref:Uncharacterized protein n=1 Tax=Dyella solisilvae TaxID=1920168 RepID=A0A370K502_9GAMM|nr:hypothetical protein [Dyella solisilvae]RDI97688.1 hypothetical protein DVT68_15505 [Dyella solisilvae]